MRRLVVRALLALAVSAVLWIVVITLVRHSVDGKAVIWSGMWAIVLDIAGVVGVCRWARRLRGLRGRSWRHGRAVITRTARHGVVRVNVLDPVDWSRQQTRLVFTRPLGARLPWPYRKVKTDIWIAGRGSALTAVLACGPVVVAVRPDDVRRIEAGLLNRQAALELAGRRRHRALLLLFAGVSTGIAMVVLSAALPDSDTYSMTFLDWVALSLFLATVALCTPGVVGVLRWHRQVRRARRVSRTRTSSGPSVQS